ncbi:MAG: VOC family protein [Dorea sp.]|nr:VOC family protein [Dorea sp.]
MLTNYVDGYQHIGIPTDDIEKTKAFYKGLGFQLKWETFYEGNPVAFFEYGPILIETYEKNEGASNVIGAIDHIALSCTDIVACVKEAREAGYVFREGPAYLPYWEHGVMYVTILGPNHEIVEFIQKFTSEEEKEKAVNTIG